MDGRSRSSRLHWILVILLLGVALAPGCKTPARFTAEDFRDPPRAWSRVDPDGDPISAEIGKLAPRGKPPAEGAAVRNGRLLLAGTLALRDDLSFSKFRGACTISISGGILADSAGLFVEEEKVLPGGGSGPGYYTLAVNGRGEWKAYRGFPDRSMSKSSWAPIEGAIPGSPLRLGVEYAPGTVKFSIDGKEVARLAPPKSGRGDRSTASQPAGAQESACTARVGVFAARLDVAIDDFVFGEDTQEGPFDPARHLAGDSAGDLRDAQGLFEEAKAKVSAFRKKPTRAGLLGVLEAYGSAERTFRRGGDGSRAEEVSQAAVKDIVSLEKGAKAAKAEDLIRLQARRKTLSAEDRSALIGKGGQSFADRARKAEAAGRRTEALVLWLAAAQVEGDAEAGRQANRLLPILEPLRFRYTVEEEAKCPKELPRQALFAPVREMYAALPESTDAEIQLQVVVKVAMVENEVEDTTRKVPRLVSGNPMPESLRSELARLEKSFPDDLTDAVVRARTLRMVDLMGQVHITSADLEGKTWDVIVDDAKKLRVTAARLGELRSRREAEKSTVKEYVEVPSKLHSDSARLRVAYRLSYGGHRIEDTVEGYAASEQWSHPADKKRGVPASTYSTEERDRTIAAARDRAVARLRTGIARERIIEKLEPDEATRFILRFARSSAEDGDREMGAWRLQSAFGLDGVIRDRVLDKILKGRLEA